MAIPSFIDQTVLTVSAGNGGHGCASIHREKFKPLGGPDGGNGGNGGSVILKVDPNLTTLVEFHRQSVRRAGNGQPGRGDFANGANGEDGVLARPRRHGRLRRRDRRGAGRPGRPGRRGRHRCRRTRWSRQRRSRVRRPARRPGFALLGEEGESRQITLELKVVADIGLVGFPSAGKSSLIAAISRARPKIADYPFTTLIPNLGVVVAGSTTFTVADVPGLIEGASEGRGLGHDFLRHIERCQAIVHVIDCATYEPGRDPLTDLDIIEAELTAHGGLEDRPRMVALNKVDVPDAADLAALVIDDLKARGLPVFPISTKTGSGLQALTFAMAELVAKRRAETPVPTAKRIVIRPEPIASGPEFTITRQGDGEGGFVWRVRGEKPERWVRQTDFANPEAVGYLADRFARLGIEEELLALGALAGDAVAIGAENPVVFDFAPQVEIGAEILSRRGEDQRLMSDRPAAQRRRAKDAEYHAAKAAELEAAQYTRLAAEGLDEA